MRPEDSVFEENYMQKATTKVKPKQQLAAYNKLGKTPIYVVVVVALELVDYAEALLPISPTSAVPSISSRGQVDPSRRISLSLVSYQ